MNAVIYCRVSTAEQTKNLSLATQKVACRSYCAQQGYQVVKEFTEAGESAKTTNRPELQRMIEFCRSQRHRVQVLVVYNLTRFSRNRLDHELLRAHLLQLGITLRSVTEPIDETAVGRLMEGILSAFGQFDNNQKAERSEAGMKAALKLGRWTFQAPLGYRSGSRDGPSLILEEERPQLVRMAFMSTANGGGLKEVLDQITQLGLRTRRGKRLSAQSFHSLLRNPLYAGRVEVPKWDIRFSGDFESIVSEAMFDRVQVMLDRRGRQKVRHNSANPDFPLRRFVRCGHCDAALTGSWSRGRSAQYAYYHCMHCKSVRVQGPHLEAEFVSLLEGLMPSPAYVQLFEAIARDAWKQHREESKRRTAVARGRVVELRHRTDLLEESFVFKKDIDRESYHRQRDKLREELTFAERAIEDAHVEELDIEAALAASEHVLSNAPTLWQGATVEQRQRLQGALFPKGLTHDGENFGTAVTCIAFSQLQDEKSSKEGMASPRGLALMWTPKIQGKALIAT